MPKDWFEWHKLYQSENLLQQRLQIVQKYISASLDIAPAGKIQIVSACAGDGRDLLGVLATHPRAQDVRARLVELDPQLVARGTKAIAQLGLTGKVELIQGDATLIDSYKGAVPADIVIFCGVFGNLPNEEVLQGLIRNLPYFAKTGAFVLWTRGDRDGANCSERVRQIFKENHFSEVDFQFTETGNMAVGRHRFDGQTLSAPIDEQFFVFTGTPDKAGLFVSAP
ncbi:class I SAM-dependent methyltransferase family protein [Tumidithrix elongata RA019]|uniref:Class I SAM-dependent methyltransferase family protein n=1 Tax=Tumidithrix elongata BACA0141 TaxID=2716417 RepID=A0AAW9PVU8_9CYAN|nr:class I SAM-dependent methyltransferase family protein [Tumidithrix elongata RA019]